MRLRTFGGGERIRQAAQSMIDQQMPENFLLDQNGRCPMTKPCKRCGHAFEEHAPDHNYPDSQKCWHGAASGEGCAVAYDDRCKDYVNPDGK